MKMKVRTCQAADPEKVRNIIDLCIKRPTFIPVCILAITRSLDSLLQIVQEVYKLSQFVFVSIHFWRKNWPHNELAPIVHYYFLDKCISSFQKLENKVLKKNSHG